MLLPEVPVPVRVIERDSPFARFVVVATTVHVPDEAITPLDDVVVENWVTLIEPLKRAFDELPSTTR